MEQTNDRLAITAGLLTLPNTQGTQAWFSIFVSESSLHFEISEARHHDDSGKVDAEGSDTSASTSSVTSEQDGATYTYSAPKFLLDDVRTQGDHQLPAVSVAAMERFTRSGGRVIEAMVASIQTEMRAMAHNSKMESAWCDHPERLIYQLVRTHVPADIQLAVFAMLKAYRPDYKEDGAVIIKRREDTS